MTPIVRDPPKCIVSASLIIDIASLFFSGVATLIFFIVTGGRVPSYLGCSGSIFSVVLSVTGYQYTESTGLNSNIAPAQGAILILSLSYIMIALLVIIFGYSWLEFLMPPGMYIQSKGHTNT
jgi:putative pyrimidine permease RutG